MPIIKKDEFIDAKGITQALQDIRKEVDLLKTSTESLQKQTREVNKEGTGAEAKKRIDLTKKLETATEKLVQSQTEEAKQLAKLKALQQEENKILKTQAKESLGLTSAYEKQSRQLIEMKKAYKDLIITQGKETKQTKKLRTEIQKLDTQLKKVDSSLGDNTRKVGNYGSALKGVGKQLLGAAGIVGGVDLLTDGLKLASKQYSKVIEVSRKLEASFNVGSESARRYSAILVSIADTFDQDYNEVTQSAINVSKRFGISVKEATDLIEQGFLKGSNNTGEFVDILKETPGRLADAGLSAEQAFAVINQQVTEGIYSDKGVQTVAEGAQRLRENTKAVQDALAPLDASIKKQIEQEVAAGNSFRAVQLVSEALNDSSLTAQETQTIIADVFGGEGEEAALGYIQNLKDIDENLDNVKVTASESEQSTLNLSKAWNTLSAEVGSSEGIFTSIGSFFKDFFAVVTSQLTAVIRKMRESSKILEALGLGYKAIDKIKDSSIELTASIKKQTTETIKAAIATGQMKEALILANRAVSKGLLTQAEVNKLLGISTDETEDNTNSTNKNTDALNKNNKSKEKNVKLTDDQASALKQLNGELGKNRDLQRDLEQGTADQFIPDSFQTTRGLDVPGQIQSIGVGEYDPVKEAMNLTNVLKEQEEKRTKDKAEETQKRLELEKLYYDALKQFGLETFDTVTGLISQGIEEQSQRKLDAIQQDADREKKILEQQLQDGLITEEQFRAQSEALDKKANRESAKVQKQSALYQIGIDTAAGIVKALASSAPPLNFINAALVGAQGAIQAALVSAKPLPAFKDGVIGFNGKGTGTSDSNTVKISNKESVITAKGTSNAPLALKAINEGMLTDSDINKTMASKSMGNPNIRMEKTLSNIEALMSNMGWSFEDNGVLYNQRTNGEINRALKK